MTYTVELQQVTPRALAAVRDRMPVREVPARFMPLLDQVYAAARAHAIPLDGQNVFVYRDDASGRMDVAFGVGVRAPFAPVGRVEPVEVPGGTVATTTHWGDYAGLGAAHDAVVAWCRAEGRALAGVAWEVYGHWDDDPAKRRTDIFQLLR
jgi:effector-binding domain-containing protein